MTVRTCPNGSPRGSRSGIRRTPGSRGSRTGCRHRQPGRDPGDDLDPHGRAPRSEILKCGRDHRPAPTPPYHFVGSGLRHASPLSGPAGARSRCTGKATEHRRSPARRKERRARSGRWARPRLAWGAARFRAAHRMANTTSNQRPTKAERREQARRERAELQRKMARSRRRRRVVGVVLLVAASCSRSPGSCGRNRYGPRPATCSPPHRSAEAARCGPVENVGPYQPEERDRAHVESEATPPLSTYPSVPPARVRHNEITWGAGVYDSPPPIERVLHSLEHGAAVVWYRRTPRARSSTGSGRSTRTAAGSRVIVAPYDYPDQGAAGRLPEGVEMALVSWHRVQRCASVTSRRRSASPRTTRRRRSGGARTWADPQRPRPGARFDRTDDRMATKRTDGEEATQAEPAEEPPIAERRRGAVEEQRATGRRPPMRGRRPHRARHHDRPPARNARRRRPPVSSARVPRRRSSRGPTASRPQADRAGRTAEAAAVGVGSPRSSGSARTSS